MECFKCRRVLHSVAEYFRMLQIVEKCFQLLKSVLQCCIELQRFFIIVLECFRVLQSITVCLRAL